MGRGEVFKRCSGTWHPSSLPVVGAGRAWVSAPPAPWCCALVATMVVRHHGCEKPDTVVKLTTEGEGW